MFRYKIPLIRAIKRPVKKILNVLPGPMEPQKGSSAQCGLLDTFRAFPTRVTSDLPYLAQGGHAPRENEKRSVVKVVAGRAFLASTH